MDDIDPNDHEMAKRLLELKEKFGSKSDLYEYMHNVMVSPHHLLDLL